MHAKRPPILHRLAESQVDELTVDAPSSETPRDQPVNSQPVNLYTAEPPLPLRPSKPRSTIPSSNGRMCSTDR